MREGREVDKVAGMEKQERNIQLLDIADMMGFWDLFAWALAGGLTRLE
jgi:hypothetical protein